MAQDRVRSPRTEEQKVRNTRMMDIWKRILPSQNRCEYTILLSTLTFPPVFTPSLVYPVFICIIPSHFLFLPSNISWTLLVFECLLTVCPSICAISVESKCRPYLLLCICHGQKHTMTDFSQILQCFLSLLPCATCHELPQLFRIMFRIMVSAHTADFAYKQRLSV